MKMSRLIYGLLLAALIWSYFKPWTVIGGQPLPGWAVIIPLSFFYFLGLVLGVIVLFTGYRAVRLSIWSGILMFGNNLIAGLFFGLISATEHTELGAGFTMAFFMSLIFLIIGPISASGFDKSVNTYSSGESVLKRVFVGVVLILIGIFLKKIFNAQ